MKFQLKISIPTELPSIDYKYEWINIRSRGSLFSSRNWKIKKAAKYSGLFIKQ
jgi:hypothetical protein